MEPVDTNSLVVSALTYATVSLATACLIPGLRFSADHIPLSPPHTNRYTVLCDEHKKAKKKLFLFIKNYFFYSKLLVTSCQLITVVLFYSKLLVTC